MADADLDVIIRQLARQQHKSLMAAAKGRRDKFNGLAAKAKSAETKERYRRVARDTMLHADAAAKRLQMSADNAADSYARAMRKAAEAAPAKPVKASPAAATETAASTEIAPAEAPARKAPAKKPVKKKAAPANNTAKKATNKPAKKKAKA